MTDTDAVVYAGLASDEVQALQCFVETLSITETAHRLGDTPARIQALLLARRGAVNHLLQDRAAQTQASRDTCIAMLWQLACYDPADMMHPTGMPRPLPEWPVGLRMALKKCEYNELTMTWKYEFTDRANVLKVLLDYFKDPRTEAVKTTLSGAVGTAIFNIVGHQKVKK